MSNVGEGRRVAIIGAGPSGFYAAEQLLSQGFEVDLLDLLPTPFGLVRAGVAPDHPKIKSVTRMYEKTARKDGFRFFGGVQVGEDIRRAELLERYHAVLYAVGTGSDNRLGIPGEDRPGSYPATRFVAWYNGHPHASDDEYDLSATRAVVVGNGNVAIDIARMLVLDPDELAPTDTADHALAALAAAQVEEVVILGRRGPAQAAFTNPELRELGELSRAAPIVDPAELELDEHSRTWLETEADPTAKRNFELLKDYSERPVGDKSHRITLRFLRSPVELIGEGEDGKVEAMRIVRNRIEPGADGALRAVATDVEEVIPCGLVIRSIGYRGTPLEDVPFDVRRGLIRNAGGRVCDEDGTPVARRVRRRLDQARPERRDRDEQEGRRRHGGADRRGRRGRTAGRAGGAGRRGDGGVAARQRPRRGRVGRLAGDRRARARARRVAGPPAREARARAPARRRGPRHAGRALRGCGQAATASAARAARRPTASRRP